MTTKQCRDCHRRIPKPKILCPACKAKAVARNKATHRELQKQYQAAKRHTPRKCATEGCTAEVTGKKMYCDACKHEHKRLLERELHKSPHNHQPKRTTGMAWMDNFKPWMQSGLSYSEFQKGEWMANVHNGN
jgi:hypothetical protein